MPQETASDYDVLLRIARKRRNIRGFKQDPVPEDTVEKVIEVARWAMSGANGQPWEFVVVKDQSTRAKIFELYQEQRRVNDAMESTRVPEMRHPSTGTLREGQPLFKDAPVIIAVCGDPRTLQATVLQAYIIGSEREVFHMNMANVTFLIHLAAAALGLGAQWVSTSPIWESRLKALLGIPDFFKVPQLVPIGYLDYKPPPPYRRKLEELMHTEKYDVSRFRSDEDIVKFITQLRQRTAAAYRPISPH